MGNQESRSNPPSVVRWDIEWKQFTLRLPVRLKEQLQQEADRRGVTFHDLILFILWKWLRYTALK